MRQFLHRVERLSGWRRRLVLWLLGAAAVLALPPVYAAPVLALSFAGFLLLLGACEKPKAAFGTGWWFGFGFFTAGLYWISIALLIDVKRFIWFVPFSLFGLSAFLGLFIALAALLAWKVRQRGLGAALALAGAWTLHEWLRGFILTGLPWNPMASVWVAYPPFLQGEAWLGPQGMGFLTVLTSSCWWLYWRVKGKRRVLAFAPAALLLGVALAGMLRLDWAGHDTVDGVRLRLVQPNIEQSLKWKSDLRASHLRKLIAMSRGEADPPPTHVIWAETAVPYLLEHDEAARLAVAGAVPENGLVITGAVRTSPPGVEPYQVWNSMMAIDETGEIRAVFDKSHLVPFGEYMPLKSVLPLKKITEGSTDFSPGPGPLTLDLPGLPPVGPLICYEVIFPHEVADPNRRPSWLLNLTNDSWYGNSAGPHQHWAQSVLRAVEEGVPLVRVANGGISGIVDSYGRPRAKTELETEAVVDGELPTALATPPIYARLGDGPYISAVMLLLLVLKFMVCHSRFTTIQQRRGG